MREYLSSFPPELSGAITDVGFHFEEFKLHIPVELSGYLNFE
jgi:hypothetical protein